MLKANVSHKNMLKNSMSKHRSLKSRLAVSLLAITLSTTTLPSYSEIIEEKPSAGAMLADVFVARPLLLVGTVLGTGAFVVSLPFSILGGNVGEAADTLVLEPATATFFRCLGCKPGQRLKSVEEKQP